MDEFIKFENDPYICAKLVPGDMHVLVMRNGSIYVRDKSTGIEIFKIDYIKLAVPGVN